jgi:hypothetical protein
MQGAGMKVLRVWLDGIGSTMKGTATTSYPDLETTAPGTYNDQVLNLLDGVMVNAHSYGIKVSTTSTEARCSLTHITKLLVTMYSSNALGNLGTWPKQIHQIFGC